MYDFILKLPKERLEAIRDAYIQQTPIKEIQSQFGLERWQVARLGKMFRAEGEAILRRPRKSQDIPRIALPTRRLSRDGCHWNVGSITLPRISLHVQVLQERGHAEI